MAVVAESVADPFDKGVGDTWRGSPTLCAEKAQSMGRTQVM